MKLLNVTLAGLALIVKSTQAFAPQMISQRTSSTLSMSSSNEQSNLSTRRSILQTVTTGAILSTTTATAFPSMAFAAEYTPKFDDMKQIYALAVTLDSLKVKVGDPDQFETALVGLREFNRAANFYPGYAKNFILKSVKASADADPRVGYVRQASSTIGSCQELLEGRQGLFGADAAKEAVSRVSKAQQLLGKFLMESGVEDSRFKDFVATHS